MIHDKTCAGRQLFRSGPDLVIYWSTGEIFYDLTVVHELSNSNQVKSCSQLLTDAIKRKRDTYVTSGKIPDFAFQCIPVLSCGSLHQNTRSLLRVLSEAALLNRRATEMEFKLLLQELNGTEVYAQLRNHLSPEGSSRYSI